MADTRFVRPYAALERHRAEMTAAHRQRGRRVSLSVIGALAAVGLTWWLIPPLTVLAAGAGLLALFFSAITGASSVPADQMVGAEGEARVLDRLKQLPDGYTVFNQLRLPDPRLPNGERELDFVVVGPDATYLVEVKNARGLIYVRPDQRQWPLAHKAGCGGRPGWNAIDNPLTQIRAQAQALDRWLLQQGRTDRIVPLLCFARSDVALNDRDQADVPILTADELVPHVLNNGHQPPMGQRAGLVELLARRHGQHQALAA